MGTKSNIRSFRYSDEVAGILEAYKGNTLNEKFENLVLHCFWEGKRIDDQLAQKRKEFDRLCKQIQDKRTDLMSFDSLQAEKKRLSFSLDQLSSSINGYHERLNKSVTQIDVSAPVQLEEKCVTKGKSAV